MFFEDDEGTVKVVRRTYVTGSAVDNKVEQSSWNLDKMDGTGPSGATIDWSKTNIFVIDFEWLGVGRCRMGVNINGVTCYVHEFLNANILDKVYMSKPNLPLRFQMETTGSSPASTMECICCSVMSEGGRQNMGILRYKSTEGTHINANAADTIYALVGIRLQAAKLNCVVTIEDISVVAETSDDFEWLLFFNPTVAGSPSYSNETNSCVQTFTGATANTVTGGLIMHGGFTKASATVQHEIQNAIRLGSAIDGTVDEIVLAARPLGANADIQGSISWRELS